MASEHKSLSTPSSNFYDTEMICDVKEALEKSSFTDSHQHIAFPILRITRFSNWFWAFRVTWLFPLLVRLIPFLFTLLLSSTRAFVSFLTTYFITFYLFLWYPQLFALFLNYAGQTSQELSSYMKAFCIQALWTGRNNIPLRVLMGNPVPNSQNFQHILLLHAFLQQPSAHVFISYN